MEKPPPSPRDQVHPTASRRLPGSVSLKQFVTPTPHESTALPPDLLIFPILDPPQLPSPSPRDQVHPTASRRLPRSGSFKQFVTPTPRRSTAQLSRFFPIWNTPQLPAPSPRGQVHPTASSEAPLPRIFQAFGRPNHTNVPSQPLRAPNLKPGTKPTPPRCLSPRFTPQQAANPLCRQRPAFAPAAVFAPRQSGRYI